jgi:PAS domain S-box-containing protein
MRNVDTERSKIVQSEKTLYRTIFENTGTTTIIVEEDMTISMVNKECEKLLGYSRDEIVGIKRWDDLIAEEEADRLREYHNLRRIDPDAVPKSYQTKLVDRTGQPLSNKRTKRNSHPFP